MSLPGILVVDDDPHARGLLRRLLGPLGQLSEAASAPAAEELLAGTVPVDVVLTDMAMPDPDDGLRVLRAALAKNPDTPVIVLTAFGNIEGALDTIQKGAFDYLTKPFDVDAIVRVVRRALEQRRLVEENKSLRARVKQQELVGRSQAHPRGVQAGGARGGDQRPGADHRRDGHREGAGGAEPPPALAAERRAHSWRWTAGPSPSR